MSAAAASWIIMLALLPLGLTAGALTTVAGLGGGQLLVLALAATHGPREALAITAPALLAGNLHRFWMYRRAADRGAALAFAAGAIPAGVVAGWLAVALPPVVLSALLIGSTLLAVARAMGLLHIRARRAAFPVAGAAIGAITATSSGGGLLLAPLLLSTGLGGPAYSATAALCASALHVGRLTGYAAGGSITAATAQASLLLALAIFAGNRLGDRARRFLPPRAEPWVENATLVGCVVLGLVGAALG
jgi:uncharacterized membrane protein YfcA